MKAIILTRVSTKMQEEGLSLLAQSNRLQDYAERKGLEVIRTFEIVESSTHGERKQFMEMINFCKKQKETIAIVADTVDRVQRSFKESVLLDELMRKDKIELHFYREGMVLNSKSTSVDIMRWDFSVMGAKAYVLQLSENVRRSTEQKNKNGENVLDIAEIYINAANIDCDRVNIAVLCISIILDVKRRRRVDVVRSMLLMTTRREREYTAI